MHGKLAVGGSCARDTGQSIFTTTRAELLAHVLGGEEAAVAALDESPEVLDSLKGGCGQKVQVHLQENILALFRIRRYSY